MQKLDYFMYAYFYQIEIGLNRGDNALSTIKFQSEEANTDEELKLFFKSYLSEHNKLHPDHQSLPHALYLLHICPRQSISGSYC